MNQSEINPQDQSQNQNNNFNYSNQKKLPNSVGVLVLGICSIFPGCVCAGLIGIACGIVALVLAKKDFSLYNANPNDYALTSYNNLKAGRVCAIIGLCLSSMIFLFYVVYFLILGAAISMLPWGN